MSVSETLAKRLAEIQQRATAPGAPLSTPGLDIVEHLPTLLRLGSQCQRITEFGVRHGASTTAFLAASPQRLRCVDIMPCPVIDELRPLAPDTDLTFELADSATVEQQLTDLLFIDSDHTYEHLATELRRHGPTAQRYIVMHDTSPDTGSPEIEMWRAIGDWLASRGEWRMRAHYPNNYGLTVLERCYARNGIMPHVPPS